MTFRQILEQLVMGTPGALGAAVMASDGIPVDEFVAPDADIDLGTIAVEFQPIVQQTAKVAGSMGDDDLAELVTVVSSRQLYFRPIDDEFYLFVALAPNGVLGKTRYLAGQLLRDLQEGL